MSDFFTCVDLVIITFMWDFFSYIFFLGVFLGFIVFLVTTYLLLVILFGSRSPG